MIMKRLLISLIFAALTIVAMYGKAETDSTRATSSYLERLERYDRFMAALTPDGARLQFAGNMGLAAAGPVWVYGKNSQWNTSLLLGYIPRHDAKHSKLTMTLKQDFTPWTIHTADTRFFIYPLTASVYFNTVFSDEFWTRQPERYPKGYYWFSTRLRPSIAVGQRVQYAVPEHKRKFFHSMSAFYEFSTCDYTLIQKFQNHSLTLGQILTFSIGMQVEWE